MQNHATPGVITDTFSPHWGNTSLASIQFTPDTKEPIVVFSDGTTATNVSFVASGLYSHELMFIHNETIHVYSPHEGHIRIPMYPPVHRTRRDAENLYCSIEVFRTPRCTIPDYDIFNILWAAVEAVSPHIAPAKLGLVSGTVQVLPENPSTRDAEDALSEVNGMVYSLKAGEVPCMSLVYDNENTYDNGVVGVAYVGGACHPLLHTGIVTVSSYVQAVIITIHEMGHLFGLTHVETDTVMNSQVDASSGAFSPTSSAQLGEWWQDGGDCLVATANTTWGPSAHYPSSSVSKQIYSIFSIFTVSLLAILLSSSHLLK